MKKAAIIALASSVLLAACAVSDEQSKKPRPQKQVPQPVEVSSYTEAVNPSLELEPISTFTRPTNAAQPEGQSSIFVTEKSGKMFSVEEDGSEKREILNIEDLVEDTAPEQGLLGIAFPGDFASSKLFYIYYTANNRHQLIASVLLSDDAQETRYSMRTILDLTDLHPSHNGGQMQFGPDGYLYIGYGDGGVQNDANRNAQDTYDLRGKLLRIAPERAGYAIPKDNPFARGGGAPEIVATGLRNPWRFSFDTEREALVLGDVGQYNWEEINIVPLKDLPGTNFGWSAYEGYRVFNADQIDGSEMRSPAHVYPHNKNRCSVVPGYVVNDPEGLPSLQGRMIFSDYCQGLIGSAIPLPKLNRVNQVLQYKLQVPALASFGQGNRGQIFVVSLAGKVDRLVQANPE